MDSKFEYKYLVSNNYLDVLRKHISPYVELDTYTPQGRCEYTVKSIYFDTDAFDLYYEKMTGIRDRNKFRIRGYVINGPDDEVFLEIKQKANTMIKKYRFKLPLKELHTLFDRSIHNRCNHYDASDYKRFLFYFYRDNLKPAIIINYEREAFHGKFNNFLRITFDKNIRSALHPDETFLYRNIYETPCFPGFFVLETKFQTGLPPWLSEIISELNLKRRAVSKYVECLRSHRIFMLRRNFVKALRISNV